MGDNGSTRVGKLIVWLLIVLLSIPGLILTPLLVISLTIAFSFVNGSFVWNAFKDDRDRGIVQGSSAELEQLYQSELREGRLLGAAVGYLVSSLGAGLVLGVLWSYDQWGTL